MRILSAAIAAGAGLGLWTPAGAVDLSLGSIGCAHEPKVVYEITPQVADNRFPSVDQKIVAISATRAACVTETGSRWQLQGSLASVDEQGRRSYEASVGAGYSFRPTAHLSITPIVLVGYEHHTGSPNQAVGDLSVTFEGWRPAGQTSAANAPTWVFALRPEYTSRHSLTAAGFSSSNTQAAFNNFVSVGYDAPLGPNWRGRITIAHNYYGGDATLDSVGSLILAARPIEWDTGAYPWNAELWLSEGEHYHGILFGFSRRFTR